jgi:hypothetical protein
MFLPEHSAFISMRGTNDKYVNIKIGKITDYEFRAARSEKKGCAAIIKGAPERDPGTEVRSRR